MRVTATWQVLGQNHLAPGFNVIAGGCLHTIRMHRFHTSGQSPGWRPRACISVPQPPSVTTGPEDNSSLISFFIAFQLAALPPASDLSTPAVELLFLRRGSQPAGQRAGNLVQGKGLALGLKRIPLGADNVSCPCAPSNADRQSVLIFGVMG